MRAVLAILALGTVALVSSSTDMAAGTSSQPPRAGARCSEAIYSSPAESPPRPIRAIRIGPAVFNSLARLTSPRAIDKPTDSNPFFSVKSPLTILAQTGEAATVTIVRPQNNVAIVYNRRWLSRLADWHYQFAQVPRSIRLQLCRDSETKQALNTQYAGGFLLRKLGCITIEVRALEEGRVYRSRVPIGVAHC